MNLDTSKRYPAEKQHSLLITVQEPVLTLVILVLGMCGNSREVDWSVYVKSKCSKQTHPTGCLDESWHLPFDGMCVTGHFSISGLRRNISLIGDSDRADSLFWREMPYPF